MKNGNDVRNELKKSDPVLFFKLEALGQIEASKDRKYLSQEDLAKLSGVSLQRLLEVENGGLPSLEELVKLAHALNLEFTLIEVN